MLDQTRLPAEVIYRRYERAEEVAEAIRSMVIRGAPAIGVAAAMGIALGMRDAGGSSMADLERRMEALAKTFAATRPTAVNLFWAINRMRRTFESSRDLTPAAAVAALEKEALLVRDEDIEMNRRMAADSRAPVATHCTPGRWPRQATEPR
jgi:methylthioribose-1-phosphate isomerase